MVVVVMFPRPSGIMECVADQAMPMHGRKSSSISRAKTDLGRGMVCYWLAAACGLDTLGEHRPSHGVVCCVLKS